MGPHRSTIKLGAATVRALHEISEREGIHWNEICAIIEAKKLRLENFTEALRAYVVNYFREAATEEGHRRAGHGKR